MKIINKSSLQLGGFAGLKETRLVVDNKVGGNSNTWNGLGHFIYLADANFLPLGETHMHPHRELDVISIMLKGRVRHEGSLGHGKMLDVNQVQAQRAGGEGFTHNEINPDNEENRMLQLWVLPETSGMSANYKSYNPKRNELTRVYGGDKSNTDTLDSQTIIEVAMLDQEQSISKQGDFLAYITGGEAQLNGQLVSDGDLVRGNNLELISKGAELHLTLVSTLKQ
mgnify:CR=1 FL=1